MYCTFISYFLRQGNVRQCCGNRVVSIAETCCGTADNAIAHAYDATKVCCGTSYVAKDTSLCCVDDVDQFKVSIYYNASSRDQKLLKSWKELGFWITRTFTKTKIL